MGFFQMPSVGGLAKSAGRGVSDGLSGNPKKSKEQRRQRHVNEGKRRVEILVELGAEIISTTMIIAAARGTSFDPSVLTRRQMDELQNYGNHLIAERAKQTSQVIDEATRDHGQRSRGTSQRARRPR